MCWSNELTKLLEQIKVYAEQNAKKSEEDAKNATTSINTTIFIKKLGVDSQSINGSFNVKTLKENDVCFYSPNNKPTADDIGAIPAVKKDVNGLPICRIGLIYSQFFILTTSTIIIFISHLLGFVTQ